MSAPGLFRKSSASGSEDNGDATHISPAIDVTHSLCNRGSEGLRCALVAAVPPNPLRQRHAANWEAACAHDGVRMLHDVHAYLKIATS